MLKKLVSMTCFSLLLPAAASAATDMRFFNVIYENDVFFQQDGGYTNGFALNYARGFDALFNEDNSPDVLLPVVEWAGFNKEDDRLRGVSYQFGQMMDTPDDIQTAELIEDQQPYAGLLMGRINYYALNKNGSRRMGFVLGVVGPPSGAEQAQKAVHHLIGSDQPQGWDNQIRTEPVFRLESSRARKLWQGKLSKRIETDVSSFGEWGVGNLMSNASAGIRLRLGGSLSESFPLAMGLPGREVNPMAGMSGTHWQVFVSAEVRYEFNNILIEGNTFRDSHGVDLTHEQARLGYGYSFNVNRWAFTYSGVFNTKAYATQPGIGKFGSISITYRL